MKIFDEVEHGEFSVINIKKLKGKKIELKHKKGNVKFYLVMKSINGTLSTRIALESSVLFNWFIMDNFTSNHYRTGIHLATNGSRQSQYYFT